MRKRVHGDWVIVSARFGVLSPERVVQPYDFTLSALSVAVRRAWGRKVAGDLALVVRAAGLEGLQLERDHAYSAVVAEALTRVGFARAGYRDGFSIWRDRRHGQNGR
jgi:hypothetical protein